MQRNEKPSLPNSLKGTWVKPIEVIKEPCLCSSLRNSLLYFPGTGFTRDLPIVHLLFKINILRVIFATLFIFPFFIALCLPLPLMLGSALLSFVTGTKMYLNFGGFTNMPSFVK